MYQLHATIRQTDDIDSHVLDQFQMIGVTRLKIGSVEFSNDIRGFGSGWDEIGKG